MIASSRTLAVLALASAVGLHLGGIVNMTPELEAETEGSAGSQDLRLGTGFADLVAGTLASETVEVSAEAPQPDTASPPPPEAIAAERPDTTTPRQTETTPSESPSNHAEAAPRVAPEKLEVTSSPESPIVGPIKAETLTALQVAKETVPSTRQVVEATVAKPSETSPEAVKPLDEVEKQEPTEVLSAREPEPDLPKKRPERRKARPAPQGNSDRNTTAGATAGTATAEAVTRGSGGASSETGNAAASNYPGIVMRHLSRVPRPRVRTRGAAVVAFRLADNGTLSGLSLANSSGSDALDRAAVGVVKGAAPFPAPPSGARRSFTIEIKGR